MVPTGLGIVDIDVTELRPVTCKRRRCRRSDRDAVATEGDGDGGPAAGVGVHLGKNVAWKYRQVRGGWLGLAWVCIPVWKVWVNTDRSVDTPVAASLAWPPQGRTVSHRIGVPRQASFREWILKHHVRGT